MTNLVFRAQLNSLCGKERLANGPMFEDIQSVQGSLG